MQKDVLSLYRSAVRLAMKKSQGRDEGKAMLKVVREEFEKYREIEKSNILKIEYLIRKGKRQIALLGSDSVHNISVYGLFHQ